MAAMSNGDIKCWWEKEEKLKVAAYFVRDKR